jgi:hypothetical protein
MLMRLVWCRRPATRWRQAVDGAIQRWARDRGAVWVMLDTYAASPLSVPRGRRHQPNGVGSQLVAVVMAGVWGWRPAGG